MAELAIAPAAREKATGRQQSRAASACAAVLLVLMGVLAGGAALRESVTIDEVAHIGAGVSYLQRLDLRLNEEHPPLAKVLAAVPLVARGTRADYSHQSWTQSDSFFAAFLGEWIFGENVVARWNDSASTVAWARVPMLLLTLALGWFVFLYARQLGGDWAGVLCTAMYASSNVFLAFGPLVTTDVAVTLFSLVSLRSFADLWDNPNRRHALKLGGWLAAALLSKFSAGLLLVTFLTFAVVARFRPLPLQPQLGDDRKRWIRERRRAVARAVVVAATIVYCTYFVLSLRQPTDALSLLGTSAAWAPVRRVLLPAWLYVRGVLLFAMSATRPTFVLGRGYEHGVWFYFPVLFLLKSSLGFLALLAMTLFWRGKEKFAGTAGSSVKQAHATHWRTLWVGLFVFAGACMLSPMSISFRHFMIPVTLTILLLAPLPKMIADIGPTQLRRAVAAVVVLLTASGVVASARAYPYYIPYFNALASSHPAYWWASDSNLDWNQSLPEVRAFAQQQGLHTVSVDSYGFTDPADTIPNARLWDCQQPAASDAGQWVFVSADMILDAHNCPWLMQNFHQALAGGSMYAVRLPDPIPPAGSPGGPPRLGEWKQLGGNAVPGDIRALYFDLYHHPEKIAATVAEMQRTFEEARQQQAK